MRKRGLKKPLEGRKGAFHGPKGACGRKKISYIRGKSFLFLENKKSNGNSIIPSFTHPLCSNFSYLKNPFLPLFVLNDVFRKMIIHDHSPP